VLWKEEKDKEIYKENKLACVHYTRIIFGIIGGKKNQELFRNNRVIFWKNCLKFTYFLAVLQLNLWWNTASNTASKNHAKRLIYSIRAVTYNQKYFCDCSIRVSRSLMHVLCLQVTMAAGDYLSSNLMCYSGGTATSPFCCNGQPLPRAFLQCNHLCCNSKCIFSCKFRIHLTARTIITRLYGEASVMFRT